MKHTLIKTMALASAMSLPHAVQAEIISYHVTNPAGPHSTGLVAGGGGTPDPYWKFTKGSMFTVDTHKGTGSLSAKLINNLGIITPLELEFTGLLKTLDGTKYQYFQGNGGVYNPAKQDYFTDATGTFDYEPFGKPFKLDPKDPVTGNYVVQFGKGANYTDPHKSGFAAWLQFIHPKTGKSLNWDIYGTLKPKHKPTDVPEPAPLALLAIGVAGLAIARRRKRKIADV